MTRLVKPLVKVKVGEALAAEGALTPNPVVPAEAKAGRALAAGEALKLKPAVLAEVKAGRALAAGEALELKPAVLAEVKAGEALKLKLLVLAEVKAGEAPKRVGMVNGLPNAKLIGFPLIESDFSSTPLESFITHPVNVSSFSFKYISTGMDVFSIHLFSPES